MSKDSSFFSFGKKKKEEPDQESKQSSGFFSRFSKKKQKNKADEPPIDQSSPENTANAFDAAPLTTPTATVSIDQPPDPPTKPESAAEPIEANVQETAPVNQLETEAEPKRGFLSKLKAGLKKTRGTFSDRMSSMFRGRKIDEDLLEELEELLIGTDIGVQTTMGIIETIRKKVNSKILKDGDELKSEIKKELVAILANAPKREWALDKQPMIALIVGVNGVGKTTTIGKVANYWRSQGKSVVVCAADTFRAAAVEQLQVWAKRADVDIVLKEGSSDPASVVFDALQRVKERNADILLIDTAGRLHNNPNLMKELDKIRRIIEREFPGAPHHVLLILDAVTGQNGLQQAKQFVAKVGVSDLIITKLDGTAKGGIAIAISKDLDMPIRFIGVGEQIDDMLPFDPQAFVDGMFEG